MRFAIMSTVFNIIIYKNNKNIYKIIMNVYK